MSYEKYIKYKTKYLNLKAEIHNNRIQNGGSKKNTYENDFIQTLGSTPGSEIYNNNNLVGGANDDSDMGLPNHLSSSEKSLRSEDGQTGGADGPDDQSSDYNNNQIAGGTRKIKKNKNVFSESESDSDFNESDSSMLSFSSVESDKSSDLY
jgi:hypothetical protein